MLLLELVQLTALEVSLFPSRLVVTQVYVRFVLLPVTSPSSAPARSLTIA